MEQTFIIKDLLCACGTKCGELTLPSDHPFKDAPLSAHNIEKVECDDCVKARKDIERMKNEPTLCHDRIPNPANHIRRGNVRFHYGRHYSDMEELEIGQEEQ